MAPKKNPGSFSNVKDTYLLFFLVLALLIFIYDSFKKKEKQK
ncbi:MAG: hypothetical protein R2790_08645 [Flavobacterium haoranii]